MIKRYIEAYNFENVNFKDKSDFGYPDSGFVIRLRLREQPCGAAEILNIGGSVKIVQRLLRPEDKARLSGYEMGRRLLSKDGRKRLCAGC